MFDVGFAELVLCFVIALVVLGPDKLPAVARALGRWTGAARSYVRQFSAQLEREAGTGELKRDLDDATRDLREGAATLRDATRPDRSPGRDGPAS